MRGLLSYGALTAKTRAMMGRLLKDEDYRTMAALDSVLDVTEYLNSRLSYSGLFPNQDSQTLHRSNIERSLADTLCRDYAKLYDFASMRQRRFFRLYLIHFEVILLKYSLRAIAAGQPVPPGITLFEDYFKQHSQLDLPKINTSSSVDELIDSLKGTIYYPLLDSLRESEEAGHFDYEMSLDLFYFRTVWAGIKKSLSRQDQELIRQNFGTELDLLNLQWIYRAKKYYASSGESIKKLLIPIRYRLREPQFKRLIEAENGDEFFSVLAETWYGTRLKAADMEEKPNLEFLNQIILDKIHRAAARNHPYSMAMLYAYLYFKEDEIRRIVMVIEGVRYQIGAPAIMNLLDHT